MYCRQFSVLAFVGSADFVVFVDDGHLGGTLVDCYSTFGSVDSAVGFDFDFVLVFLYSGALFYLVVELVGALDYLSFVVDVLCFRYWLLYVELFVVLV